MNKHFRSLALINIFAVVMMICASSAYAIPTFQTYIDGATAQAACGDEETWFSNVNPFNLFVVGAFGAQTSVLSDITLVLAVPEGETGTVSISNLNPLDETPTLLTAMTAFNPLGNANEDILSDVAGLDGYDKKEDFETFNMNQHAPTKDDLSDFVLYDLGDFGNTDSNLKNYNAEDGTITTSTAVGEQREYLVSIGGFSYVHFTVYGYDQVCRGNSQWKQNPPSHDATWDPPVERPPVPEPATMLLFSFGMMGTGLLRRKCKMQ